jgi:hypothetical protein
MRNIYPRKKKYTWCPLLILVLLLPLATFGQGVVINSTSATSSNLKMVWSASDPERIDAIYWNPNGLTGSEANLTNPDSSDNPCSDGLLQYFGNSWAPPDPQAGGKVLVGAGTTGARMRGPDSKVVINSTSTGCTPSANAGVTTLYKFWQGGMAANKMRATRTFSFETAFNSDFRPYIPRLFHIDDFSQVIYPNATNTALISRTVGGFLPAGCPFGCEFTDWAGNAEETAWFAIHDAGNGRGIVIKRAPSSVNATLWVDWDGGSNTNASSVLLKKPVGGFTGEVVETQTFCFYDSSTWTPSLTLPPGC